MVTAKSGIFDSQSAGPGNQEYSRIVQMGRQYGPQGLAAQNQALQGFQERAAGRTPSLAEMQMQQGLQQQQRAALGLMGQTRGGNLAGAYSQALGAQSGAMSNYNQQAALLRAQEQLANQQALFGAGQQMSGQQFGYEQLGQQGSLAANQQNIDWQLGKGQLDLARDQYDWNRNMGIGQMILGGVSALGQVVGGGAMSDMRAKEDLRPVSAADAAAQIEPLAYRYKPGMGLPEGQQIGVSAQQLAGTPLGSTLVGEGPDGMLRVDGGRAGIASLAASGENARRIRMLEQQLAEQSGQGNMAQRYGTREEGMANERRAKMLSDDIAAQRGLASVRRDQPELYDFRGAPQMRRGGMATVDPFESSTVGPNTTQGLAGLRARYFPELVY